MTQVALKDAEGRLAELIAAAVPGEEIELLQEGRVVARLVPVESSKPRPRFGSAKGSILYMAEDFDAPLEDFKEYME